MINDIRLRAISDTRAISDMSKTCEYFTSANDLENYRVNLHHIIHVHFTRRFRHAPIGIFQKFAILTNLQRFQNKK